MRRPPSSTLFPNPPLSRSRRPAGHNFVQVLTSSAHHRAGSRARVPVVTPVCHDRNPGPLLNAGFPCDTSAARSEEHTSELQSQSNLVCRLLLEKKKLFSDPSLRVRPRLRIRHSVSVSHAFSITPTPRPMASARPIGPRAAGVTARPWPATLHDP